MGNEYHTASCADTKINYFCKLLEDKDKPGEGPDSVKQFENEMDSNVATLVARMCLCIRGSGRVAVLNLGYV